MLNDPFATPPLPSSARQQRDMLLDALVAFLRHRWLDAALAGNEQVQRGGGIFCRACVSLAR